MALRGIGQSHGALDVQNRVASVAVPTTPTLLILPTIVTAIGGLNYNTTTGVSTTPFSGLYDTVIQFNVSVAAPRTFYFYIEGDSGGGYTAVRYSGRQINVGTASDGQITITSTNYFAANTAFRFYFWVTGGAASIATMDIPGTTPGTVTVPAARIMITAT